MKLYLRLLLFFFFLGGVWGVSTGPVYCISPEKSIKLENRLVGCTCPPSCTQVEEKPSVKYPPAPPNPEILLRAVSTPPREESETLPLLVASFHLQEKRLGHILTVRLLF